MRRSKHWGWTRLVLPREGNIHSDLAKSCENVPKGTDSPVTVRCYAGYKGEQEPQRFLLGEHWLEVEGILKEWREPATVFFRVRASDGRIYVLRLGVDATRNNWSIEFVR